MELKVRVLTIVASPANYSAIIKELAAVVGPYNSQLSRLATRAIGQIAIKVSLPLSLLPPSLLPPSPPSLSSFCPPSPSLLCLITSPAVSTVASDLPLRPLRFPPPSQPSYLTWSDSCAGGPPLYASSLSSSLSTRPGGTPMSLYHWFSTLCGLLRLFSRSRQGVLSSGCWDRCGHTHMQDHMYTYTRDTYTFIHTYIHSCTCMLRVSGGASTC